MDNDDFFFLAVTGGIFKIESFGHDEIILDSKCRFFLSGKFPELNIYFGAIESGLPGGLKEGNILSF